MQATNALTNHVFPLFVVVGTGSYGLSPQDADIVVRYTTRVVESESLT